MRRIRGIGLGTLGATALAVPLTGCGGDSGIEPATKPKAAARTAQAKRLLDDPRSPASTVVRFWDSIRHGALPLSLSLYEPRVVSAVGVATFAGMLNDQRAASADTRLNVLDVERAAGGWLVVAETVPKAGPKARHSFFLRRVPDSRPARWRIAYDTLSAAAIQSYVQTQTQRSIDPAAVPGRKAVAAGDRAAEAYRAAALAPVARRAAREGEREAPRETTTTTTTPTTTTTTP